jgi:GTP-binding protein
MKSKSPSSPASRTSSFQFLKSAAAPGDYPSEDVPEIAITGRSNAGKSSFLNQLAVTPTKKGKAKPTRQPPAKVSQTPGKTRLLNFFATESYRWVDMPGYGFASRAGDEMRSWRQLIEEYLAGRPNLVGAIVIMDIRREWSPDEEQLRAFFNRISLPFCVVLTKADKVSSNEARQFSKAIAQASGAPAFVVSNATQMGGREVEAFCFENWVKPAKASAAESARQPRRV